MESLESKLDQLSHDQRREVEAFVDFLLYRSDFVQGISNPSSSNPAAVNSHPPAIPVMTPMTLQETPGVVAHDQDLRPSSSPPSRVPDEYSSPIQEITVELEDRITRDYVDFGKCDQQSSPATEALKKAKAKLIHKSEQDKSPHHIDWID
ncbi:MAG: hypothetical protein WCF90_01765 [Methanomicrobiales archaeon]